MTNVPISVVSYPSPAFKIQEVCRYAGIKERTREMAELLEICLAESHGVFTYKVCYGTFPVFINGSDVDFGFFKTESSALKENLKGCERAVIFAATVGLEIDRLIARSSKLSPSKAVIFQAIGAERIEALCDRFNDEIKRKAAEEGKQTRPRFSPGYGDFDIKAQEHILSALSSSKNIGVYLNDSMLMMPSKSVTAVIGIK